jgi:hypothetical protein
MPLAAETPLKWGDVNERYDTINFIPREKLEWKAKL